VTRRSSVPTVRCDTRCTVCKELLALGVDAHEHDDHVYCATCCPDCTGPRTAADALTDLLDAIGDPARLRRCGTNAQRLYLWGIACAAERARNLNMHAN
jgi:hypothetical protein